MPQFTVIDAPNFKADPARHGTRSEVFILVHFGRKLVLIGGTQLRGRDQEVDLHDPQLHCCRCRACCRCTARRTSAQAGDTALFFGLSGTGKTTLSSDPDRRLIGDDEHGWSDTGVFNFEGGCYAKVIKLSTEAEPQIYATTRRFGTILENVVIDPERATLDLDDASLTENTRGSYPITFIDNAELSGRGGHPKNIVMLTADAYGVLPPIARLTPDGAMYHFLSGYTARWPAPRRASPSRRRRSAPASARRSCRSTRTSTPRCSARRSPSTRREVWLVNTGWTGGPYGVGSRMKIAHTRAMITAALTGQLDNVELSRRHPIFNLDVPTRVPGVPDGVLDPRSTWPDAREYDEQAKKLAQMFVDNFKTFESDVAPAVKAAGPGRAVALRPSTPSGTDR